ncbi:putative protein phosphatase 2C 8 [Bienertia sinuspersici]
MCVYAEDEDRLLGQPSGCAASTEEQRKMSKPLNTTISHGVISVVGRRRSMEDAVTIAPGLFHVSTNKPDDDDEVVLKVYDFFAVYNGCGSHVVAQRCKERLHHLVVEQSGDGVGVDRCWERVMVSSFARMEDEFGSYNDDDLGVISDEVAVARSMALVVLVGKEEIVVANCGHSRAILYRNGAATPLCRHQPERPEEKERIGTCTIKEQMMSAPEVTVHKRTISDDFLIIATDGLWNVVSNDMACDIVKKRCSGEVVSNKKVLDDGVIGNGADACAAMLVELALARGSKDNISVIVVELRHFRLDGTSTSSSN